MSKLEELNLLLENKCQELASLKFNTFILNTNISSLLDEIEEIKLLIKEYIKEEENNE